jgi:agmatinase
VRRALADGAFPVLVGGNHLSLAPAFGALLAHDASLQIISLDAHHDLGPAAPGTPRDHGNFWVTAFDEPMLDRIAWVGARRPPLQEAGTVRWVSAAEWRQQGPDAVLSRLDIRGAQVILDVDLDVLDGSSFPATVSRRAGGPDWLEVASLISTIASECTVRAVGISEYNSLLDDAQRGSLNSAGDLLLHTLNAVLPPAPAPNDEG